jgi:glyoxylase-like metal-dependent hydrolase (beta-lactamase superfamily II)
MLVRALIVAAALAVCAAARAEVTVTEWVSEAPPLFVRSAIVEGETELGLVDTQFTLSNTHRLIADLIERGKPLAWIYVTHPHLDHFNGAALIRAAFPDATFYGQPEAIAEMAFMVETRQAGLGAAAPGGAANLPATAPDFFVPVPDETLTVDGAEVRIVDGVGDHPHSSFVWVPEAQTVVMGDIVFGETHGFMGDHRDIDGWIATVEAAKALGPEHVVIGHARPDRRYGPEVLDGQIGWLQDLKAALAAGDDAESVAAAMTAKYPAWDNAFIFEFSYGVERFPR